MIEAGTMLCVVAIAVVAIDMTVRLVISPHCQDKFLEEMLDAMIDASSPTQLMLVEQLTFDSTRPNDENLRPHSR